MTNVKKYEQPDISLETTQTTEIQRGNTHKCIPQYNPEPLQPQCTPPHFNQCKSKKRNDKTEEYKPWSSGYGRRLTIERPWFRILPQDTNRNLLVKIVPLLEKNENKLKTLSMAYLKFNKRFASFQIINYLMGNFAFTSF